MSHTAGVFAVVFGSPALADIEDYCDAKLCGTKTHAACDLNGLNFQDSCPCDGSAYPVDIDDEMQLLILDEHNRFRSQVAIGYTTAYETAAGIPVLVSVFYECVLVLEYCVGANLAICNRQYALQKWDTDLAYISGFNARTCVMKHDECRATTSYPYSGQNLAYVGITSGYYEDDVSIKRMIAMWFEEYPIANMSVIRRFPDAMSGPEYGHFTAMIHEKSAHIGCSAVRYLNIDMYTTYLVCNYEFTNMSGMAVYTEGEPCSKCPGRCSRKYPGLCVQ